MNLSRRMEDVVWTREFTVLFILSLSYFYCLPLLRTGVVLGITASELRIYDLVFIFLFFVLILPRLGKVLQVWRSYSSAHRYLFIWLVMAFIGLFITLMYKETKFIIGCIRYFRFVSFSFVFILGFYYIKNRRQVALLFDALLISIVLIATVGTLQTIKLLPNFWPEYYSIYWRGEDGGFLATATLSPNHTHYSLVMAIGIIMILARIRIFPKERIRNLMFLGGALPMVYSMVASKGRSGWLMIGVYLIFILVFSKANRILIVFIVLAFGMLAYNNLDTQAGNSTVRNILLYRTVATMKETKRTVFDALDEDEKNLIEKVDDSRWLIYTRSVAFLLANPQYLLIGAGFQNASKGIGGTAVAAHNAYINVVAEHGIIGLVIYLTFLYYLYDFARNTRRRANSNESFSLATHWIGLYAGLLVANFFGEILYPGRALFTFLGTFFIITVVFLHPAWRAQPKRSNGNLERKNVIYHP